MGTLTLATNVFVYELWRVLARTFVNVNGFVAWLLKG
jgi:nitrate reductase NapE component